MKNIIKNNKGITLIELIITIAIMAIVIQTIYSIFFVGNKSFNISKNKGFAQQEARIAMDIINKELRTAKEISKEESIGEYYSLSIEDNKLSRKAPDGSGKKLFLFNSQAEIEFEKIEKGILYVKIKVVEGKNRDEQEYIVNFSILLENLEGSSEELENLSKIYYSKYE